MTTASVIQAHTPLIQIDGNKKGTYSGYITRRPELEMLDHGEKIPLEKPNSQQLIRRGGCDPIPLAFQTNDDRLFPNNSSRLDSNKRNMR